MQSTRKLTTVAVMAALIFVVTWLVKIPIPVSGGAYLNFGDIVIYICAYVAGGPMAALAAAIGSAVADLAGGAALYILPTLIVKALMALAAGALFGDRTFGRYLIGCIAGGAIMVAGYGLFELIVFDASYAIASLPFNLVQWGGSVAAAAALFEVAKRLETQFRRRFAVGRKNGYTG